MLDQAITRWGRSERLSQSKMEELSPGMGMADIAGTNEVEECLAICISRRETVRQLCVEELTEEFRGLSI